MNNFYIIDFEFISLSKEAMVVMTGAIAKTFTNSQAIPLIGSPKYFGKKFSREIKPLEYFGLSEKIKRNLQHKSLREQDMAMGQLWESIIRPNYRLNKCH